LLPGLPTEIMNDGAYAIIQRASLSNKRRTKNVDVDCPQGMRAMSAGAAAASGRGEPDDWRVIYSMPKDDGTGWQVFARFDGKGDRNEAGVAGAPGPYEWSLRVRLVCAKPGI